MEKLPSPSFADRDPDWWPPLSTTNDGDNGSRKSLLESMQEAVNAELRDGDLPSPSSSSEPADEVRENLWDTSRPVESDLALLRSIASETREEVLNILFRHDHIRRMGCEGDIRDELQPPAFSTTSFSQVLVDQLLNLMLVMDHTTRSALRDRPGRPPSNAKQRIRIEAVRNIRQIFDYLIALDRYEADLNLQGRR